MLLFCWHGNFTIDSQICFGDKSSGAGSKWRSKHVFSGHGYEKRTDGQNSSRFYNKREKLIQKTSFLSH